MRELVRKKMDWHESASGVAAAAITGAVIGAALGMHTHRTNERRFVSSEFLLALFSGGPYQATLGITTMVGVSAIGEGGTFLFKKWYHYKRNALLLQQQERQRVPIAYLISHCYPCYCN